MKSIRSLAGRLAGALSVGDAVVAGVAHDSRTVAAGDLYIAKVGDRFDGHAFLPEAVSRGAVAAVVRKDRMREFANLGIALIGVDDPAVVMGAASAWVHGDPTLELRLTGVTGTNGKTTTVRMVDAISRAGGGPTGTIGTLGATVGDEFLPHDRTTPEAPELQALFRKMLDSGVAACAMEVASHALVLARVAECAFDVVAFTNLTPDHLDFHGTMEAYRDAKALLFTRWCDTARSAGKHPVAVVNTADPAGRHIAAIHRAERLLTYGGEQAEIRADSVVAAVDSLRFRLHTPWGTAPVRLPFGGTFQVGNALAAAGCGLAQGASVELVAEGLGACPPVPGRFEPIDLGQPFAVVVDYAHTPDGLENVLLAARSLTAGRLIVVFGCGGNRDRTKRPLMGAIAARLANQVWVTSDNPRDEDPAQIVYEVLAGAQSGAGVSEAMVDRRRAIAAAFAQAGPGDTVVIAGKGHEDYQEIAGVKYPFDDRLVAREELLRCLSR